MVWKKINSIVSYFEKPVFGTVKAKQRVMALVIDKDSKSPYLGLAREITKSNQNNPDVPGNVDQSRLIIVRSEDLLSWKKIRGLQIKGIEKIIVSLSGIDKYFIGLEDPDIYNEEGVKHVYFTIAFKYKEKHGFEVYLGHAQGKSLDDLTATKPVLSPIGNLRGFKEVCISPNGRINLSEAQLVEGNNDSSVIASAKARGMASSWNYLKILLNPANMKYKWCQGELSPCCFLPQDFFENYNLLVGIINGREPKKIVKNKKVYGKFRPGLILFNPETGEIPWISPKPLFEDLDARKITFASDFIQTKPEEGILYCHVNDSFVRAYKINASELRKLLPRKN